MMSRTVIALVFGVSAATSHNNLRLKEVRKLEPQSHNNSTAIHEGIDTEVIPATVQFASADARGIAAYHVGVQAAACGCMFDGYCSCDTAQRFMSCIAKACDDHKCDCQNGLQFMYACHNMSAVCPSVGLSCSHRHAVCVTTEWVTETGSKSKRTTDAAPIEAAAATTKAPMDGFHDASKCEEFGAPQEGAWQHDSDCCAWHDGNSARCKDGYLMTTGEVCCPKEMCGTPARRTLCCDPSTEGCTGKEYEGAPKQNSDSKQTAVVGLMALAGAVAVGTSM